VLYADKAIHGLCLLISAEGNAKGFPRRRHRFRRCVAKRDKATHGTSGDKAEGSANA